MKQIKNNPNVKFKSIMSFIFKHLEAKESQLLPKKQGKMYREMQNSSLSPSFSFGFSCLAVDLCRIIDDCSFRTVHLLLIPIFHLNSYSSDWKRILIPIATSVLFPIHSLLKIQADTFYFRTGINSGNRWHFLKYIFLHKQSLNHQF